MVDEIGGVVLKFAHGGIVDVEPDRQRCRLERELTGVPRVAGRHTPVYAFQITSDNVTQS